MINLKLPEPLNLQNCTKKIPNPLDIRSSPAYFQGQICGDILDPGILGLNRFPVPSL